MRRALACSLLLACSRGSSAGAPPPGPTAAVSTVSPPASAAAAPPPAYDLAADVAARIELARGQLGEAAPVDVEAGVFVLVGDRPGASFDAGAKLAHDALVALLAGRFTKPPARAVTVYLFPTQAPYQAYCKKRFAGTRAGDKCDTTLGFYRPESRELFANLGPGLPTLTHEIVHPIVESDFPAAPAWLNEGLGSLYEKPVFPAPGEIHGAKNWRLPALLAALSAKGAHEATRLDALFGMNDRAFRDGDEELHYAVPRYLCQWLDAKGELWPFYHAWRDGLASDPTGEKAFERATGERPGEAQGEWERWVRGL
jgi:hypothetical protein